MADSTTNNQKRSVATKGTRHVAFAIHPDMCFPKGKKKAQPYENWVESTQLKKGQTTTVKIDGYPVWTSIGELGPDSEPAHAGVDKGLISKTYRAEAKALSYSPNLFMEGNPVVRNDDLTSQNHANTVGRVLERPWYMPLFWFLGQVRTTKPWSDKIRIVRRGNVWIIVDRENKVIVLLGTQEFQGPGATGAFVNTATNTINNTWSGTTTFEGQTYQVRSLITGSVRSGDQIQDASHIWVAQTTQPVSQTSQTDPAWQTYYDLGGGYQHSTDNDGGVVTAAHEFGHSMGIPDGYTEGPRNPDGTRSIVRTSPPGSLMGYIDPGSKPTPADYNSLITGTGLVP